MLTHNDFMARAVQLSLENIEERVKGQPTGGPFGVVIVKDGEIIAEGANRVTATQDPTAHAEIVAIRAACKILGSFQLPGCTMYTSCEPCPMCLGAVYWAHVARVYYANTRLDAARIDFDDSFIYEQLALPMERRTIPFVRLAHPDAICVFERWAALKDKIIY
jgi:tRNA(Arg) A34 adenosine deaminase TadA